MNIFLIIGIVVTISFVIPLIFVMRKSGSKKHQKVFIHEMNSKEINPDELEFYSKTKVIAIDTAKKVLCFTDFDKTPVDFQIIDLNKVKTISLSTSRMEVQTSYYSLIQLLFKTDNENVKLIFFDDNQDDMFNGHIRLEVAKRWEDKIKKFL